ncbi:coadhesin-like [Ruditapes philippinarum]|uniref:coadhesin-like n=1 Tax=Ruditapes philippinarum TaxID=129788 RepID=UPI00295A5BE5|nr:coadhesin-like [Ruditapes philippinarum]
MKILSQVSVFVAVTAFSYLVRKTDCLDCFTCINATAIPQCKATRTCSSGEVCYAEHTHSATGNVFSFGCRPAKMCSNLMTTPTAITGSLVGRSSPTDSTCTECCMDQNCNRQLCQNSYPHCKDSPKANCAVVGAMLNICLDTQHAKISCRRFCGLCNYYDGSWASWMAWSKCDVTCGKGVQSRSRTCTEPSPSGGGLDCVGNLHNTKSCELSPCPVHGGWSGWASWGSCSVTCGIGMQRRDRSCSNPYPSRCGNHCFGESRDDRICLTKACQDGGWSSWNVWTRCSATCGEGIKTRTRLCDNPLPSLLGQYCVGEPFEVSLCNDKHCQVTNGAWGQWTYWSTCTLNCKLGIQSRHRNCNNPEPSIGGNMCTGSSFEIAQCDGKTSCEIMDGTWSIWSSWNYCHPTGPSYEKDRYRICENGTVCFGKSREYRVCG